MQEVQLGHVAVHLHRLREDRVRELIPSLRSASLHQRDQRGHEAFVTLERTSRGHPSLVEPFRVHQHLGVERLHFEVGSILVGERLDRRHRGPHLVLANLNCRDATRGRLVVGNHSQRAAIVVHRIPLVATSVGENA